VKRDAKIPTARVALVTGVAKGMGREIALRLAAETAGVAVHYHRDRAAARKVVDEIKQRGKIGAAFSADLTVNQQATALVKKVEKKFGRIDILVNTVGPIQVKPWSGLSALDWDHVLRGNLLSAFFCLRAALPGMRQRRWGRIINLGYHRAEQLRSFPNIMPYAVAKTGLLILTRTVAASEAAFGITANLVSPGLIEGGVLPRSLNTPRESLGTYKDVAEAVAFLASDGARAVTGTNLIVAGSWKM
jgi:3-oxoacyl-[acyl-carrier protein] reductase